jgi:hypothetical protein
MAVVKKSSASKGASKAAVPVAKPVKGSATAALDLDSPGIPEESLAGVVDIRDRWFPPKVIGAIFGLDEKWLASVREGLKGIDGPPFKKLGTGRSSPIRYNYGAFKDWFDSFPSHVNTHGKVAVRANSALNFFADRDPFKTWLFAEVNGEPQDIVVAINAGEFDDDKAPTVYWLNYWECLAKAALHGRMAEAIDKHTRQLSEMAIAILEEGDFKVSVPQPKTKVQKPDRVSAVAAKTRKRTGGL